MTRPTKTQEITVPLADRAGALALGLPFVLLGQDAATHPGDRVAMAGRLGVPWPEAAVRLNGAAMVAGGLALCVGVRPRLAAAGLALCLIPTTLAGHAFWLDDDPAQRKRNGIQFLKNLGLLGGLTLVTRMVENTCTPRRGVVSVDRRTSGT